VIGVKEKGDRFAYGELSSATELRLDHDVTILPPKKFFLPQIEDLVHFSTSTGFESVIDETSFILLGVHPYDVFAIAQLDLLFGKDNPDVHYMTRREQATIIACDVETPSANIFAGHMGTAMVDSGYDILLTKINDYYLADIATEKGEAAAEQLTKAPNATEADTRARDDVWKRNTLALRQHELQPAVGYLPHLLADAYTHPVWEERAKNCFSCGSCNVVCPTCYCFDVQDDFKWDMKSGRRYRIWDGCMLSEFAVVAGNHNFRPDKAERFRHRYYRKGKYIPDTIGQTGCVGCGRCVTACVANIANPVEVYNRLVEGS
jgi:ferredoxin